MSLDKCSSRQRSRSVLSVGAKSPSRSLRPE
jgi:hypothetical protein